MPKPKGFGKFDALMKKLVKVPSDEIDGKQHCWEEWKSGRRRGWHCRWCDVLVFTREPPHGGCDWKFKK